MAKIRTVIFDERFEYELAYIQNHAKRADEFIDGAVTVLSRDPEAGCRLDSSNVWFVLWAHRGCRSLLHVR
jgi:hypothetical protein